MLNRLENDLSRSGESTLVRIWHLHRRQRDGVDPTNQERTPLRREEPQRGQNHDRNAASDQE
jgi:hypothetical protein